MKPRIRHPKLDPRERPEARELARLVGQFIEYWGFKAVQGRIWCYLFLSARPLNSRELAQLAEVSPALVTQSVQLLLEYQVILEAGKGPNGMLLFRANPDSAAAVRGVLAAREAVLLKKLDAAAEALTDAKNGKIEPSGFEIDRAQCVRITQWIGLARLGLELGLETLGEAANPFTDPREFRKKLTTLR